MLEFMTKFSGQKKTAYFRRFYSFSLLAENKAHWKCRCSQKPAVFRRKPQQTGGTRRKLQIGVCPLGFASLPCVAKPLQTIIDYLRIIFAVTHTDFIFVGIELRAYRYRCGLLTSVIDYWLQA